MTAVQSHMLPTDAFAWHMEERDPALRSTIVSIMRLDQPPDWTRLRRRMNRVARHVPHLRQRVRSSSVPWGSPRWTTDDGFDLDFHLVRERLATGSWNEVLAFAGREAMTDFDRARPLWRCTLLDGLADGSSVLVTKIHHCLTDGLGGVQITRLLVDAGPVDHPTHLPPLPPARAEQTGRLHAARAGLSGLADLADLGRQVVRSAPSLAWRVSLHPLSSAGRAAAMTSSVARFVAPVRRPFSGLLGERRYGRLLATMDVPLDGLRTAAAEADAHVNDAFLAAVVEGLYLYHDERHALLPEIRATIPVSVRRPGDGVGGNRITLVRATLPAGEEDINGRIGQIAEVVRSWRREPALAHTEQIAFGLNLLPPSYLSGVFKRVEVVASNVPGPATPMWLAGAQVIGWYAFGPTIGAALNVTLLSQADECHVGINVDTHAVDNPPELVRCLRAGFDAVLGDGAGQHARSHLDSVSEVVTRPHHG